MSFPFSIRNSYLNRAKRKKSAGEDVSDNSDDYILRSECTPRGCITTQHASLSHVWTKASHLKGVWTPLLTPARPLGRLRKGQKQALT